MDTLQIEKRDSTTISKRKILSQTNMCHLGLMIIKEKIYLAFHSSQ